MSEEEKTPYDVMREEPPHPYDEIQGIPVSPPRVVEWRVKPAE